MKMAKVDYLRAVDSRGIVPNNEEFNGGDGGGGDGMLNRIKKLEDDVQGMKVDLAIIKSNYATKTDIQTTRTAISDAKNSIIMWVVSTIFLAQLLPVLLKKFGLS